MKPVSLRPWRNGVTRSSEIVPLRRNPMTGIAACCALAASGHVAAAPPSSVMNWRRLMQAVIRPSSRRCRPNNDSTFGALQTDVVIANLADIQGEVRYVDHESP